ncbi:MAG TPA: hypothetical protein VNX46_09185, partial [Candidatus Acidoferrum sp.]|nr:hypothetical protein [Candidatus Acidoferrum sp.]
EASNISAGIYAFSLNTDPSVDYTGGGLYFEEGQGYIFPPGTINVANLLYTSSAPSGFTPTLAYITNYMRSFGEQLGWDYTGSGPIQGDFYLDGPANLSGTLNYNWNLIMPVPIPGGGFENTTVSANGVISLIPEPIQYGLFGGLLLAFLTMAASRHHSCSV